MVCHIGYVFDVLLHYYNFSGWAVADFDKVDTSGEAVVADAAAGDVENTDSLAFGTLDDDAATERVDVDVLHVGVADAHIAVLDIFVCKLAPVAVGQPCVEAPTGDDDAVGIRPVEAAIRAVAVIGGCGRHGVLEV